MPNEIWIVGRLPLLGKLCFCVPKVGTKQTRKCSFLMSYYFNFNISRVLQHQVLGWVWGAQGVLKCLVMGPSLSWNRITQGNHKDSMLILCISTGFWVLRAPKSWSKPFFSRFPTFFVHFKAFSVISRLKSLYINKKTPKSVENR